MPTLSLPVGLLPEDMSLQIMTNTQIYRSPMSGAVKTAELPGARWQASLSYNILSRDRRAALQAFLVKLAGSSGRFYLQNYAELEPRGIATGAPVIKGAAQVGRSLETDGWTPSQTGILLAGDYIEIGGEFKMVVADANSDVSGNATLEIEPPIRTSPADNSAIITSEPKMIMMLVDDKQASFKYRTVVGNTSFSCVEAIV